MDVMSGHESIIRQIILSHSSFIDNAQDCYSSNPLQTILKTTRGIPSKKSLLLPVSNPFGQEPQDAFRTSQARDGLLPRDDLGSAVQVGRVPKSALDRLVLAGRAHDRAC